MKNDSNYSNIVKHLEEIERHLGCIRQIVYSQENVVSRDDLFTSSDSKIVEGIFDGESMIDANGKNYPVSPNYASKSKLVVGDKLKLTIMPDGRFMYKQIMPAERKHLVCKLEKTGSNFWAICGKKKYRILQASVTYFKAEDGDDLTVVVPKQNNADWAAVENLIVKEK